MRMDYLALADGLNTRKLVPANENILSIVKKNPTRDYYTSLYTYKDHHVEQFKRTASLAGIKDVKTKNLIFDFDDESNPENAKKDTITLYNRLLEVGLSETDIGLYFSGNKGFNVAVNINEELTRQEFVNIVFGMASDLKTFDVKINDEQRIIRVPFSRHPKSKLHKIPLVFEELESLPVVAIKELAKDLEGYDISEFVEPEAVSLTKSLNVLKATMFKKVGVAELEDIKGFDENDLDFSQCPKWLAPERFALQEGYFYGSESVSKGERNIAFMILASTFRNQGFSAEHTQALLEVTAEKQAKRTEEDPYTPEQLQREVINAVFSNSWKGGIYSSDEEILQITRKRFGIEEEVSDLNLVQIGDVGNRFKSFAANFLQNRIMTGIDSLDQKLVLTTSMAIGILGAPSSGKTSLLNTIIEHQSKNNIPCIYQSLDMSDNLLYLRLLQKYSRLPIEVILESFQQETPNPKVVEAYTEVLKNYSNVHFNFRSAMTVEQIDKDIEVYKKETGNSPKLIAVDYLEKVRTNFSDTTASSGLVASQLSDLAKKHDAAVIVLLQPQKSAGDPSQPLLSMRKVKGASQIEQDLRCIITAWRPGFNPQDMYNDRYLSLAVVKNNLGELCQLDYAWDGMSGAIKEMDSQGRKDLLSLRRQLEEQRQQFLIGDDV